MGRTAFRACTKLFREFESGDTGRTIADDSLLSNEGKLQFPGSPPLSRLPQLDLSTKKDRALLQRP